MLCVKLEWDDMMRMASMEQLLKADLDKLMQPVIWRYSQVLAFPPMMAGEIPVCVRGGQHLGRQCM